MDKSDDQVVTFGADDTTKAAGHTKFDAKATNITVAGKNRQRQTLTTGFTENHSGVDQATTTKTSGW